MQRNNLNIAAISQFINQVKAADLGQQREIRMDISQAKALSYTLSLALAKIAGDYESLLQRPQAESVISVKMDGGNWNSETGTKINR